MSRSISKGPYVDEKLAEKVEKAMRSGSRKPIKTWARSSTVTPDFVGLTFSVHNGKTFKKVLVTEDMVGHKLGEFSLTWFGGEKRRTSDVSEGASHFAV